MKHLLLLIITSMLALPAAAQSSAVIDLKATPAPLSVSDYEQLLSCTLKNDPDKTRRYAQYHLLRRDVQSPDVNAKDPDSGLLIPIIQKCHAIQTGQPIAFSLDRLIADWAKAHGVTPAVSNTDMRSLAQCVVTHNPWGARAYIGYPFDGTERSIRGRRMLMQAMVMPPCTGQGQITIDHGELTRLIVANFSAQRANN